MNKPTKSPSHNPLYYILLGIGCAALVGWFYLMRQLELMEWMAQLGPETHKGSMNLLAVMLWMVPALVLWKYYLRWLNQRFDIGGQYDDDRHNAQYQQDSKKPTETKDNHRR
ncbi:MAG: hypothetical protein V7752_14285 [Halopseudomonas sp.]